MTSDCPLCKQTTCQCNQGHNTSTLKTISAEDLKSKIDAQTKCAVINVLDADTYQDCHITGSINIPLTELETKVKEWDRSKSIIVYCASATCSASSTAFKTLATMQFTNVSAYEGGTREWKKKGYPTNGACNLDYLT